MILLVLKSGFHRAGAFADSRKIPGGRRGRQLAATVATLVLLPCAPHSVGLASEQGDPQFVETEVAGISLGDPVSGRQFISSNGRGKRSDDGYIHHFYLNAGATEVLDLVFYPGGVENTFYKVCVRLANSRDVRRLPRISLSSFSSRRGVVLGLSRRQLTDLLGPPSSVKERDGRVVLSYRCGSRRRCPLLKTINMPSYEARYVLAGDKLVEYSLGFPYP
jgi:hypothetical protein